MQRKKIKHSLRTKMTVLFSVVLLAALAACWLMNIGFLERYYIQNKQKVLVGVYQILEEASRQETMETEELCRGLAPNVTGTISVCL